jgi:hypothetical protein
MTRTAFGSLALAIVLASGRLADAGGSPTNVRQDAPAEKKVTRVDLGFDMSTPGSSVSVPILLEAPEGVEVGRTVTEVSFPNKVLAYEDVKLYVDGAKVETDVRIDPKNAELSVLKVTVISPKPIPTGMVASIAFRVDKTAPTTDPIKLRNVAKAFGIGIDPRAIEPVEGKEGEIQVSGTPPVVTCFFYMH